MPVAKLRPCLKLKVAGLYLRRSRKDVASIPQGWREKIPCSGLNSSPPKRYVHLESRKVNFYGQRGGRVVAALKVRT